MPLPIISIVLIAMQTISHSLDNLLGTTFFMDYFSADAINAFADWWMRNVN
jgi:hypothetical protein